jgi:hypothetical protein
MTAKLLTFLFCLSLLGIVVELIRQERLTFKYGLGWILVAFLGVGSAVFDGYLHELAKFLGFQITSNFLFFGALCAFVFLSLLLTIFLCQQNVRNDKLARKIGLLEFEIQRLKKEIQEPQE